MDLIRATSRPEERPEERTGERRGRSPHPRNTGPMRAVARCGARTRAGTPCRCPRVAGRSRCRLHGGAPGSGGQAGNRNGWKHGRYSAATAMRRRLMRKVWRDLNAAMDLWTIADRLDPAEFVLLSLLIDTDPHVPLHEDHDWQARFRLSLYPENDPDNSDAAADTRGLLRPFLPFMGSDPEISGPGTPEGGATVLSRAIDEGRRPRGPAFGTGPPGPFPFLDE